MLDLTTYLHEWMDNDVAHLFLYEPGLLYSNDFVPTLMGYGDQRTWEAVVAFLLPLDSVIRMTRNAC